jgi:hypothetical protein
MGKFVFYRKLPMTAITHQWMVHGHNDCFISVLLKTLSNSSKASLLLIEQSSFIVGFYSNLQETIDCRL